MKIGDWNAAKERLLDSKPALHSARIFTLWERYDSYCFGIRTDYDVQVVWVGPRGGVSESLRYRHEDWDLLVQVLS